MKKRFNFLKDKYFYLGSLVFIISAIVNMISAWYLLNKYPGELPIIHDLILDILPYYNIAFFYDIFIILALTLFAVFIFHKKHENKIGFYLLLFGIYLIIRGIFIVVTPFGNPVPEYNQIFNGGFFSIGAYPSGHVGTCFLAFLFSKGVYRKLIFLLFLGVVVALFLSKGHYSIDILSGIIFSYAVYAFGKKYFEKSFCKK